MKKIIGSSIGFIGYLIQVILKKPSSARKLYSIADKYDNRNSFSLAAYGMVLFNEEKYHEALKQFKKMKNNKSKKGYLDRVASMNMALSYWKLGSVDNAIAVLEDLRSRYDYLNEDILTSLSYFYMLREDYEKAIDITKEALEEDPEHAPALDNMGQIYFRQGDLEKAEEYFLKALNHKDMVDSKYYLGLIYEEKGDREKAVEYFSKAFESKISRFSTVNKDDLELKFKEYGLSDN